MAREEEALAQIVWSSATPTPGVDSDLECDLRKVCQRSDRLSPELAQDVLFWLDLGGEPRDVARWLRHELENGRELASFSTARDVNSLFSRDTRPSQIAVTEHTVEGAHVVRRFFGG
jgi:hypothetical protein